jgi:hypothetical protein
MTRRERLEHKLERRQEWAGKATQRSNVAYARADQIAKARPFGQPILVGHHSEASARADQRRIESAMDKSVEEMHKAEYHESKADGLARQLAHNVYSDDENAVEALEARIAKHEAQAATYVALNAAWRKAKGDIAKFAELAGLGIAEAQMIERRIETAYSWEKQPIPSYTLTNLRANIRRDRERIEQIKAQQARTEKAESSGGVLVEGGEWVRVTFAEKPARSVLDTLKAAGFRWASGSWCGRRESLPANLS